MMQLLVIVLNKLECLDKLLTALEEEHIPGATILDSRGMAQQLEGASIPRLPADADEPGAQGKQDDLYGAGR